MIVVPGQTGEFPPLYCTAHGKALLAGFGVAELKAIFGATPFKAHTPRTIVSIAQLAKACARIKAGTTVTFMGDFSFHPLAGGDPGTVGMPDTSSPITVTTTGMSKSFTLPGKMPSPR